jgi:hypothetical protein
MNVDETGVIAMPLRTDAEGKAVIFFPTGGRVTGHCIGVKMDDYAPQGSCKRGEFPDMVKIQLVPQSGSAASGQ